MLCNPWTGRPELRHHDPSASVAATEQVQKEELKVDLTNAPQASDEKLPLQNGTHAEATGEVKKKEPSPRKHFTDETMASHNYDDLTFAYATGFYDPYVPSSYFLSFNEEGEILKTQVFYNLLQYPYLSADPFTVKILNLGDFYAVIFRLFLLGSRTRCRR